MWGGVIPHIIFNARLYLLAPRSSEGRARPSYLTSVRMLLRHAPFQRLLLGFVFSALAFQVQFGRDAFLCS